ncbi:MAG: tail fiber domain-containing protein [Bacteroidales bacterium]|jgi:hypothetical protein|nr:tail fiber domain-containing protein [Bacteroidales bacterium]
MKKNLVIVMCVAFTQVCTAQLKVQSNGNIVAYTGTTAPTGIAKFNIIGSTFGTGLSVSSPSLNSAAVGVSSYLYSNYGVSGSFIGISGSVAAGPNGSTTAIGVRGITEYCSTGKNYGVYGIISFVNGAGILGATYGNSYPVLTDKYAGYFAGNVNITNLLTVNTTTYTSDIRYKTNIQPLVKQDVLKLNPVIYNYQQRFIPAADSLGNDIEIPVFDEKSQLFRKKHYGLIAQEVQEIYPDLVYKDADGYLSVDYVGIMPLLIQAVKEQQTQIEQLQRVISGENILRSDTSTSEISRVATPTVLSCKLYQNAPNPFSQRTQIKVYVAADIQKAHLTIYDLQGKQLKQLAVTQKGESAIEISGSEFSAGIYLYALIADGKEIDMKRMILTE